MPQFKSRSNLKVAVTAEGSFSLTLDPKLVGLDKVKESINILITDGKLFQKELIQNK